MGNTLGLGCVLLASILIASLHAQRFVFQDLLISLFVVTTSPVTSMLLIRAGIYRDRRDARKNAMGQPSEALKQIQRMQ
jgi:multicomponent K+:H+ antiporter subunit G